MRFLDVSTFLFYGYSFYFNSWCERLLFVDGDRGVFGINRRVSRTTIEAADLREKVVRFRGGDSGNGSSGYNTNSNQYNGYNQQHQQQPQGQWQQQNQYYQQQPFAQQQYPGSYSQEQQPAYNYGQQEQVRTDIVVANRDEQKVQNSKLLSNDPIDTSKLSSSVLPPGWSEHIDPASGQPYYYNSNDGTTTWDKPQSTENESLSISVNESGNANKEVENLSVDGHDTGHDTGHDDGNVKHPTQTDDSTAETISIEKDYVPTNAHSDPTSSTDTESSPSASDSAFDPSINGKDLSSASDSADVERIANQNVDTTKSAQNRQQGHTQPGDVPSNGLDFRYQQQLPQPIENFGSQPTGSSSQYQQYNNQRQTQFPPNAVTGFVQSAPDRRQQQQIHSTNVPSVLSNPGQLPKPMESQLREAKHPETENALQQQLPPITQKSLPNTIANHQQQPQQSQQLPTNIQHQSLQTNDPRSTVQGRENMYDNRQIAKPEYPKNVSVQQNQQQQLPPGPWGVQRPPQVQNVQSQSPPFQSGGNPPPFGLANPNNQIPPNIANRAQYEQQSSLSGNLGIQRPPLVQQQQQLSPPGNQGPQMQQKPPTSAQIPLQQQSSIGMGEPVGQFGGPQRWPQNPYTNGNNPQFNPNSGVDQQRPMYGRPPQSQFTGYNGSPETGPNSQIQSSERALVPINQDNQQQQPSIVQEALGRTWEGLLGFRDKTKEVVGKASETVATSARDATQTITASSSSWWGMAKERLGSMFEPGPEEESPYNLANIYGLTPQSQQMSGTNIPGNQPMPQQDGQQQRQYQMQQQQQPGGNLPPPGQMRYPPQYHGRPDYQSQPGYPSQIQQQGPQQQQQQQNRGQQYQQPPGRLPPGYTPPQPRSDIAYPMQQQEQNPQYANRPGQQSKPPLQGQWRGGPPPGRGFAPPQQQQPGQFDPRSNLPRDGSLSPTGMPMQQQNPQKQETPPQKINDWLDHPGLTGGF